MTEGEKIRVMIVDDIIDTRDQLEKLLYFEKDIEVVAKASNGREAVELARQYNPHVIVMDINMPEMDGIAATEAILAHSPGIGIIIMSVQGETDYLRRAMRAGASEFLIKPISADDLYTSIRHVFKQSQMRPASVAMPAQDGGGGGGGGGGARGQIIAVFSPKGGSGSSTIAANLAVAIRQHTQKRVALVDGNVIFGAQDVILNLVSNKTIVDLANRIQEMDRDLLNDVMATHNTQVKVLLAPPNPQMGELVTSDHLRSILEAICYEFDYVVVDTQSSFQDRTLAALDVADRIVALMTLEMPCIKNIKLFLEVADLLEYSSEKIWLVLNKADNRLGIRVQNVEENIKRKVSFQIANGAHVVALSVNQGVPLVVAKPTHDTARDISALARELCGGAEAAPAGKSEPGEQSAANKNRGGLFSRIMARR